MADLKYTVEADTAAAQRTLNDLKRTILGVGTAITGALTFKELFNVSAQFQNLRTTLGILYKDTAKGAAVFDDIKKFAAESVFSVEDLTQTVIKLRGAGIEPTLPMLRMFADTSSIAADSVGALQAITDLFARTTAGGLGLEDLNRLADRGIPVFDILSQKLGKSRLQITELGKSAEGAKIILDALSVGLNERFGGASEARIGTLSQAFSNLKDAVANAFDTIGQSGFTEVMTNIIKDLTTWIEGNKQLIKGFGENLAAALSWVRENFMALAKAAAYFFAIMAVEKILAMTAAFVSLGKVLMRNPLFLIATALIVVADKMGLLDTALAALEKRFTSTEPEIQKFGQGLSDKVEKPVVATREQLNKLNEGLNKFEATMENTVGAFAAQNRETLNSIALETELIGKSKEYGDQRRAEAEITKRTADEIRKLQDQKSKLTAEEIKEGRGGIIDATIKKIEERAAIDKAATTDAIKNSNDRQNAYQLELFNLQQQISVFEEIRSVQDEVAKLGMTSIEKKYFDIEAAAKKSARAAIAAEEARRGRKLDANEVQQYYDAAQQGIEGLKTAQDELYNKQRDFNIGWKEAMDKYIEDGTNGFKKAQNMFQSVVGNMESALDRFVETGKLNFGDFARSIIADLLKIELRAAAVQLFSSARSSGLLSIFGLANGGVLSGGNIRAFANGGVVGGPTLFPMANGTGLMGEAGPEAVMPLKRGANGKLGVSVDGGAGSVVNNYYNYNISAVDAKSVAQLFAENKRTLLSTVRSAEKELPFGGR